MKIFKYFATALAAIGLASISSCSDLTEIENRLDSIESEIKKFDSLIEGLNKNVESLYYLKDGNVITSVEETADGWKITLSDGRELELVNGEDGTNGIDGSTPEITISEDGYWVIDGEKTEHKATASEVQDAFFSSVEIKDNSLVITMLDGDVITVPIVKGFSFIIKKDGALVEGVQKIAEGATVTFEVEQTGVAAAAIVACPAGFEVELTDNALAVTAVAETKASASTAKDIAILAVSDTGVSVLSKIQVEKEAATEPEEPGEGGDETPVTAAAVLADATHECYSFNSAKFTVTFTDADKLYYKAVPATETAPTAEELKALTAYEKPAEGDALINVSNLNPGTEYKVYFVASDGTAYSEVAETAFSTRAVNENNLYEKYATGQDIVVAGVTINKTTYPDATYICRGTSTRGTNKAGLTFVESHDEITANFDSGISNLIVIGTDPTNRAKVKRTGVSYLSATDGADAMIMANAKYVDCTANLFQFNKAGAFETVSFDNCELNVADGMRLMLSNAAANTMSAFSMTGCDVKLAGTAIMIKMGGNIEKITFDNNVIFGESELTAFNVISESSTLASVTFNNNTLYNTTISDAIFKAGTISTLNVLNNYIVYANTTSGNTYLARGTFGTGEINNNFYVRKADTTTPVYGVAGTKPDWVTQPAVKGAPSGMTDQWNPSEGKFILKGYTGVGATR